MGKYNAPAAMVPTLFAWAYQLSLEEKQFKAHRRKPLDLDISVFVVTGFSLMWSIPGIIFWDQVGFLYLLSRTSHPEDPCP